MKKKKKNEIFIFYFKKKINTHLIYFVFLYNVVKILSILLSEYITISEYITYIIYHIDV